MFDTLGMFLASFSDKLRLKGGRLNSLVLEDIDEPATEVPKLEISLSIKADEVQLVDFLIGSPLVFLFLRLRGFGLSGTQHLRS